MVVSCDMTPVACQLLRDLKGSLPLALTPGRGLCVPCCDRVCGPPGVAQRASHRRWHLMGACKDLGVPGGGGPVC